MNNKTNNGDKMKKIRIQRIVISNVKEGRNVGDHWLIVYTDGSYNRLPLKTKKQRRTK
jgi:hypothetical protein